MKWIIILSVVVIPAVSSAQGSISKKEFNPKAGLSLIGGMQYNKFNHSTSAVFGVEFSMECPLGQGANNHVRQKISVIRKEGSVYESIHIEINPQYKVSGTSSVEAGIGPVAGMIFTKRTDRGKPVFIYGVGAGCVYYYKKIFISVEGRYGMTKKIAFDKSNTESELIRTANLNNIRACIKLGYRLGKQR